MARKKYTRQTELPFDQPGAGQTGKASCRVCGCTEDDCSGCVARTGEPCVWVEPDLCSACADDR